jgi:hypothetical protein
MLGYSASKIIFEPRKRGDTDSVVGIATVYELYRSGFEPRWRKIFSLRHTRPDRPWGPLSLLYNGYRGSRPGLRQPGRDGDHSHPPSAEVKCEWLYTSPQLRLC